MPTHLCTEQRICITLFVLFEIPYFKSQSTFRNIIQKEKEKACKNWEFIDLARNIVSCSISKLCFHTTAMMMIETAFFVAMNFFEKNFFSFSMQVSYFDIIGLTHKITWLNAFRNPFLIVHCYGSLVVPLYLKRVVAYKVSQSIALNFFRLILKLLFHSYSIFSSIFKILFPST